jgi:hypothetical protein
VLDEDLADLFTEQGVAMLSGVLRSRTAVTVNIAIMRAFVELRRAGLAFVLPETRARSLSLLAQSS